MKLEFPLTSDVVTFMCCFNASIDRTLREECGMSVSDYRVLSYLEQSPGVRARDIVRRLGVTASSVSKLLTHLIGDGLILRDDTGSLSLAPAGADKVADADIGVAEACDTVFAPLGRNLYATITSGSLLTNQMHGIVRVKSGRFFGAYACVEAFFQCELLTTNNSHKFGLSQTEFRILFALVESGPNRQKDLAAMLLLPPSVMSNACSRLALRGLVEVSAAPEDRRARRISLTENGRRLSEEAIGQIDHEYAVGLRNVSAEERPLYIKMSHIVVRSMRK